MAEPDPDLAVRVVNDHDVTHTVSVTVTRESGAVVHNATHEVAPGEDREVYNLRAADPEGVEAFTVAASLDGATGSVGVETSACYGPVVVQVTGDGGLYPYYAVC